MFKTIRKYPEAQVMKAGVNESAHLFHTVKEFVGHAVVPCMQEVKELLCASSSVSDLEDTCSSQSSSRSRAFTHFSSCSHCSLTVVRGSTHSSSSSSFSLGTPDPVSILCSSSSPMSGCCCGHNMSSNSGTYSLYFFMPTILRKPQFGHPSGDYGLFNEKGTKKHLLCALY